MKMTENDKLNYIMGMLAGLALAMGGVIGKLFNLI